ncbi:MAG TPA: hypothetical protein VFR09_04920 [Alphaproteobacteria bacterium]|nr:hypothetical protein [Alphaproteobacteria bacterium]
MDFIEEIEHALRKKRKELGERFQLSARQVAALPHAESLVRVGNIGAMYMLPNLFEAIMTPEERDWLENGPKSDNLTDILKELKPPREVKMTDELHDEWQLIGKLSSFNISMMFTEHDPWAPVSKTKAAKERAARKRHLVEDYEALCVPLIEDRNKPRAEKSRVADFLTNFFPMPPDGPEPQRAPGHPRRRRLRTKDV